MGARLAGLSYGGSDSLAARYGSWLTDWVQSPPTHCHKCKSPVNWTKAVRRYLKAHIMSFKDLGQCACGQLLTLERNHK